MYIRNLSICFSLLLAVQDLGKPAPYPTSHAGAGAVFRLNNQVRLTVGDAVWLSFVILRDAS